MCGIIGGVSKINNIVPTLINGLKKLEYRGYDSAGIAIVNNNQIKRVRAVGRVNEIQKNPIEFQKNQIKTQGNSKIQIFFRFSETSLAHPGASQGQPARKYWKS